jgi:hypothetical protein
VILHQFQGCASISCLLTVALLSQVTFAAMCGAAIAVLRQEQLLYWGGRLNDYHVRCDAWISAFRLWV